MSVSLGLDVGTSGVRVVAVDEGGAVTAQAAAGYPLLTPRPGWTEQDPGSWWQGARQALRQVAHAVDGDVRALGLTGQMHGSVFLDQAGEVIRPALLWNDQRTAEQCAEITARVGAERLIALAGNPALTGFQAPKVLWLRAHEPAAYARLAHVLLPKDFVRLHLTGEYATDVSDASGTLFLDVRRRTWSEEILLALEVPREWMPAAYEGPEITGRLRPEVAAELGLTAGIPVVAGGGDNAAAAVGTGIIRAGLLSSSVGTSGVLFAHSDRFSPDPSGRLHAFCHAVPGAYHLMAVTLTAGGALSWWRAVLGPDAAFEDLASEAAGAPPGAEGLIFLPYLSGERTPHLDPNARGAFVGLTMRHNRALMTRALMEGVIFALRDGLDIMRGLGVPVAEIRATGGGARSPLWRQLQADIYRTPIRRTTADEGPAYGAALLAGVGAGVWRDVAEACTTISLRAEVTLPDESRAALYERYHAVYRALYPAARAAMAQLSGLAGSVIDA